MSAKLSTHVLDLTTGRPAADLALELWRGGALVKTARTDADGRALLLATAEMAAGEHEIVFCVGDYFNDRSFLDRVPIRFQITDVSAGYHVPLLCTPWAYSTYRGS
jgi:5-hydroxyisourate hydrolase